MNNILTENFETAATIFPLNHGLIVAGILFCIGLYGVMARRNLLFMLISLELMMNAAGLAFVLAGSYHHQADGQVMYIFILTLAAAEVAIGLALLLRYYRQNKSLDMDIKQEEAK